MKSLFRLSEGSSFPRRGKFCTAGLVFILAALLSLQVVLLIHGMQELNAIEQTANQANNAPFSFWNTLLSNNTDSTHNQIALRASNSANICTQNPYAASLNTSLGDIAVMADKWLQNLPQHLERANTSAVAHWNHGRFFPFDPMSSCQESCVGGPCREDTSKIACGIDTLKEGCIIYSIGGNNMWQFELDLLEKTPCEVHTFDCTGPASRFEKPQNDRLVFHHVCLADKPTPAPSDCRGFNPICGETMTIEGVQKKLGHKRIDLLKMDIEGFEWPMFESWPTLLNNASLSLVLPFQILVEVHYRTRFGVLFEGTGIPPSRKSDFRFAKDMVKLQEHFLQMGYVTAVRDDNRMCRHCTELTLVRFRCPPNFLEG